MIATYNIKVNGVWYKAGEEYPSPGLDAVKEEEKKLEEIEAPTIEVEWTEAPAEVVELPVAEETYPDEEAKPEPEDEQPKAEEVEKKPATTSRRRKIATTEAE